MKAVLLFAFIFIAAYISAAENIAPKRILFRGKGFIKCFRQCKTQSEDIKACGIACLKKVNNKEIKLREKMQESEKMVKLMADYHFPREIAEEIVRKGIKYIPRPKINETKPLSDDAFIDGDHYAGDPFILSFQFNLFDNF